MPFFLLEALEGVADERYGYSGWTDPQKLVIRAASEAEAREVAWEYRSYDRAVAEMWRDREATTCAAIDSDGPAEAILVYAR